MYCKFLFCTACCPSNMLPVLMILHAMHSAALATLSSLHLIPAPGPASLEAEKSPGAKQNIADALPKSRQRAGIGPAAKGMEAARTRAAGSKGQQYNPGGTSRVRVAAKALAATAAKLKPNMKAAPGKAAAVRGSSLGQVSAREAVESPGEQGQQQVQGHSERSRPWLVSSHLVQLVPGKMITAWSGHQHCYQLDLPSSIMQVWYPDLQPGSSLRLLIKVPPTAAAAAAAGQNVPHCSPCSQGMPQQEDAMGVSSSHEAQPGALPTPAHGTGVKIVMDSKQVQDVVAKRGPRRDTYRLDTLQHVLQPYLRWKLVLLEKVRLQSGPCRDDRGLQPFFLRFHYHCTCFCRLAVGCSHGMVNGMINYELCSET